MVLIATWKWHGKPIEYTEMSTHNQLHLDTLQLQVQQTQTDTYISLLVQKQLYETEHRCITIILFNQQPDG
jgi:hypothetical protein